MVLFTQYDTASNGMKLKFELDNNGHVTVHYQDTGGNTGNEKASSGFYVQGWNLLSVYLSSSAKVYGWPNMDGTLISETNLGISSPWNYSDTHTFGGWIDGSDIKDPLHGTLHSVFIDSGELTTTQIQNKY